MDAELFNVTLGDVLDLFVNNEIIECNYEYSPFESCSRAHKEPKTTSIKQTFYPCENSTGQNRLEDASAHVSHLTLRITGSQKIMGFI